MAVTQVILGKKYGMLTVIRKLGSDKHRRALYECCCDCGVARIVNGSALLHRIRDCGCQRNLSVTKVVIGRKYNRLTPLRWLGHNRANQSLFECQCECGNIKVVTGLALRSGTKSCGCWRKEHARRMFSRKTLPPGEAALNALIRGIKNGAKIRHLRFSLTRDQVKDLVIQNCHYCGSAPAQTTGYHYNGPFVYNGLDRQDPLKGYVLENVVPCCGTCNRAKADQTVEQFWTWVRSVCQTFVGP